MYSTCNTIKVPHWYAVQVSDTTMMTWNASVGTMKKDGVSETRMKY